MLMLNVCHDFVWEDTEVLHGYIEMLSSNLRVSTNHVGMNCTAPMAEPYSPSVTRPANDGAHDGAKSA